jgi:hypothetical protein
VALGAPGPRDAPERQRTLRATIDWSHELLDERERACFARFAVFSGGATVAAAEAVTGADLDTLDRLVAKSLLVRSRAAEGPTRLLMLETVRAYAGERFAALPDAENIRERHHAHYLDLAEHHGTERALWSTDGQAHAATLDAETANLAAGLAWAVGRQDAERALRLTVALGVYWLMRNRYAEAVDWIDQALALPGADSHLLLRARALCFKGWSMWPLGRTAEQPAVLAESEAAARRAGDPLVLSQVLQLRSDRATTAGRMDLAEAYAVEALEYATRAADDWAIARAWSCKAVASTTIADLRGRTERAAAALAAAGNVRSLADLLSAAAYGAMCMDSDEDAKAFVARARPIARDVGGDYIGMMLAGNGGLAALFTGDVATARDAFREELTLCRKLVVQPFAREALMGLAAVAAVGGDDDRAARLRGAAEAFRYDDPVDEVQERLATVFFAPARERHGPEAWDAAAREGSALTFADAVAYGLEEERA